MILLFADDMILLSETVIGHQTQPNNLFSAASRLQLKVNMNKSNTVVFRKGGYLGARERWVYGDCMMKVVNPYKYLGMFFYKASFLPCLSRFSQQSKKGAAVYHE